jgi:hypothetical protein
MAKDLTSNIVKNKSKRYGTSPVNLLEIQFGGVTGTKYYSDRVVTIDGNTYEAVVKDWGDIDFILNRSATTSDIHITLVNTLSSPISDIFSVDNPESKVAIVYQWYLDDDDMEEADKTILFNGRITSPIKYGLDTVEFDIVNRILDLEAKVGTVVFRSNYPRSLAAHRGRVLPQVFGSVQNVPAVCVFTAGKSILRKSLNESSLTIEVDDGSVFPTDVAWTLVIEDEHIRMAANPTSGDTLTATQRAYDGTDAALHTKGTQIYEQLSSFRYQVFDGIVGAKALSISDIRVNGVLLDESAYTIDQDNYPGQIIFDTYPQIDEETETDFDDYIFDTIVNDGSIPYAAVPEALTDDNNSNYASLKSGQRVTLQRVAAVNNNNRFKRAFLSVTYFTDREEWEGNIQAKVNWDSNELGTLPDPTFDPLTEEEAEEITLSASTVVGPYNPVPATPYGGLNDMIQGPEAVLVSETYSEEVDPSSLVIETKQYDPDFYSIQANPTPDDRVPPEYMNASTEGLIGKVDQFGHYVVGLFADSWEGDVNNFRWIDWVYGGFSFAPPSGGGTARIVKITPVYTDDFGPFSGALGRSTPNEYRVKKKGVHDIETINVSPTGLKIFPVYVHEVDQFFIVIRTLTYVSPRTSFSSDEYEPSTVELWGKIQDVYLTVEYEIVKEAPAPTLAPVTEPSPVVITRPVRRSHEVEKTFEITGYANSWGDLLNKSVEIVFESDGAKPGANLYVKDIHILVESARYTFEYTDEITADVSGYYVDGTIIESDYGTVGGIITRPDQVFKFGLTWNSAFALVDLDLASYTTAAEFFNPQYYKFDFAIVEETTLREVLEKMAFQIRTDQYWEEGKHKIKVLQVSSSAEKQITSSDIETISIERSDIDELVNLLEIRYSIDYSFLVDYTPNKFRDIITIENTGSSAEYGSRGSRDETFYFDYLRDDTTAAHVANYYLSFYSVIRRYVTIKCFLNQLELEKHDIVGVSFPLDSLVNTPGRVLSSKFNMGGNTDIDQIELYILMEDYVYYRLELTDDIEFSDAIQLAVIQLISLADGVEFSDEMYFGFKANLADLILFSESLSFTTHKNLFIRDGYEGGFGNQLWGSSAWGGKSISFNITDELTLEKIFASGTGFINAVDAFSIIDALTMILVHSVVVAGNDEIELRISIDDSLTIVKV